MSPATTWNNARDAEAFLIGIHSNWYSAHETFNLENTSDIGYGFHVHEGWQLFGNGRMNSSGTQQVSFYDFSNIRRAGYFLSRIDDVDMDETVKQDMIAQARFLRAWRYFRMNWWFGGVPIIELPSSAEEAQVPRSTEAQVKQFIYDEIDLALEGINLAPSAAGFVGRGAVLALKMRTALFYEDWQRSLNAAREIVGLGQYSLHPDFTELFSYAGRNSPEIILAHQRIFPGAAVGMVQFPNNVDGGWSSMVPTWNLIDLYETADGLTIDECPSYDPEFSFYNRDPRMAMTVAVPGMDWIWGGRHYRDVLNTLDREIPTTPDPTTNENYPPRANNASKTGLTWAKYLLPYSQFPAGFDNQHVNFIVFRYAEVLLSLAEASNELHGPSDEVYDALDAIRERAGMPDVDRVRHNTKETLRELIRRERSVELAGEGLRRQDIVRWRDSDGRMVAETVLNRPLMRRTGTIDYDETDQYRRARITGETLIENRTFEPHMRFMPFHQGHLDRNPYLLQNRGYAPDSEVVPPDWYIRR